MNEESKVSVSPENIFFTHFSVLMLNE